MVLQFIKLNIESIILIITIIGGISIITLFIFFEDIDIQINSRGYNKICKKRICNVNKKIHTKKSKQNIEHISKSLIIYLVFLLLIYIIFHNYSKNTNLINLIDYYLLFVYIGILVSTTLNALKDSKKSLNGKVISIILFMLLFPMYYYYFSHSSSYTEKFWQLKFFIIFNILNYIYLILFFIDNFLKYIKSYMNLKKVYMLLGKNCIVFGLALIFIFPISIIADIYNYIIFVVSNKTFIWWFITNLCLSIFVSFVLVYIKDGIPNEPSLIYSVILIIILPITINLLFNR